MPIVPKQLVVRHRNPTELVNSISHVMQDNTRAHDFIKRLAEARNIYSPDLEVDACKEKRIEAFIRVLMSIKSCPVNLPDRSSIFVDTGTMSLVVTTSSCHIALCRFMTCLRPCVEENDVLRSCHLHLKLQSSSVGLSSSHYSILLMYMHFEKKQLRYGNEDDWNSVIEDLRTGQKIESDFGSAKVTLGMQNGIVRLSTTCSQYFKNSGPELMCIRPYCYRRFTQTEKPHQPLCYTCRLRRQSYFRKRKFD